MTKTKISTEAQKPVLRKGAVISSVCEHPTRRREYYRYKCYKCWECLKIVVEQTDLLRFAAPTLQKRV